MGSRPRIMVVGGTRPEAIKLSPVVRELRARGSADVVFVATGQHREMFRQVLDVFALQPDLDLDLMRPGQDLFDITIGTLSGMRRVLRELRPTRVLVQGDTTSAAAAALSSFYEKVPVGHVEAGLRSNQRYSPFPEEMNRRIAGQLCDLHFAPTPAARDALLAEGTRPDTIHVTGNTVVDALLFTRDYVRGKAIQVPGLPAAKVEGKRLVLVTTHRRESFGSGLEEICRAVLRIAEAQPDVVVALPVHPNPNVTVPVRRLLGEHPRIHLLEPLGYLEFLAALDQSHLILSDSGGVQEEAPSFGKPVLVLREVTERMEGIHAGVARLVGTSEERIVSSALELLQDRAAYAAMAGNANPYGDGQASRRIADVLLAPGPEPR